MTTVADLFIAPPHSHHVTDFLLRKSLSSPEFDRTARDYSRILYLGGTPLMARNAQDRFHRIMAAEQADTPACYIPPRFSSLGEMVKAAHSEHAEAGILPPPLTPLLMAELAGKGIGYASLVADLMKGLRRRFPGKTSGELKELFRSVFEEMDLHDSLFQSFSDCLELFERYRAVLEAQGLADEGDALSSFSAGKVVLPGTMLIVDGLADPDHAEQFVIAALVREAPSCLISVYAPAGGDRRQEEFLSRLQTQSPFTLHRLPPEHLREGSPKASYCSYSDRESEVEGIARTIKSLYLAGASRNLEDLVIAFPDLQAYAPLAERVLHRYGIPLLPPPRPFTKTPPFAALLSLLRAVAEDYPRISFSAALSSPFFSGVAVELRQWMPALTLRSGILSGRESWISLLREGAETIEVPLIPSRALLSGMEDVFRATAELEGLRDAAPLKDLIDAVKRVTDKLGFLAPETEDPDREIAETNREARRVLGSCLEQLSFVAQAVGRSASLARFADMLEHLLSVSYAEARGDGVRVMALKDVLGLAPERLFLGGLTDEALPRRLDVDFFLPDSVKKRLGLLDLDTHLARENLLFGATVAAASHVHLSYPLMENEVLHLPSFLLFPFAKTECAVAGVFSTEELQLRRGRKPLAASLSEIALPGGARRFQGVLSVTDIDAYRYCPRKFFLERVAGVEPPEIKEYEIEAITLGTILHRIMEKLIPAPLTGLEAFRERAREVIDEIARSRKIPDYWKEFIAESFLEVLPEIYERELDIRGDRYVETIVEKPLTGEPLAGIRLRGKIDRIDRFSDGSQVIDYKSGGANLTCTQVPQGRENLQLFLYAAMLKSIGTSVNRVGLYSLKDIRVKWCPSKRPSKKQPSGMDDLITSSLRFLEEAVRYMRSGDFSARPLNEYNCRTCHEYALCPYNQQ